MIYMTSGGTETVDLSKLSGEKLHVWWFNPRNGESQGPEVMDNSRTKVSFTSPDEGDRKDWVLVLDDADAGFGRPGRPLEEVKAEFKIGQREMEKVFPGWD